MSKAVYLVRSAMRFPQPSRHVCPNCGSSRSALVERKFLVTALRRCAGCSLMFRTPTEEPQEAADFYNHDYVQGFTTTLPAREELDALKAGGWPPEKDFSRYAAVLTSLGLPAGARILDYGCSWGYGSFQLSQAGFDVVSYEISTPRGRYGAENLGVRLLDDVERWADDNPASLDAFFSAHVLEHVPSPSQIIQLARRALKPGGLFVSFVPNGSMASRTMDSAWSSLWGEVHPNFIDDVFVTATVADRPMVLASTPAPISPGDADWLAGASPGVRRLNALTGDELLFAFRN